MGNVHGGRNWNVSEGERLLEGAGGECFTYDDDVKAVGDAVGAATTMVRPASIR